MFWPPSGRTCPFRAAWCRPCPPGRRRSPSAGPRISESPSNPGGLPISEIFASVQGEGLASGRPSSFLRFAGCNLACRWCDTAYASWKLEAFETLTSSEIRLRLKTLGHEWVVVTGGEPTSFGGNFLALSKDLKVSGFRLQLETNGTIWLDGLDSLYEHLTLSPKLSGSGEGASWNPALLRRFLSLRGPRLELKLVIAEKEDLREAADRLKELNLPREFPVILQPNGLGPDPAAFGRWMAEEAGARRGPFAGSLGDLDVRVLGQWQRVYWSGARAR